MLNLSQSDPRVSRPRKVTSTVTSLEEGSALNVVLENGEMTVKASVGAANTEQFGGFALSERTLPSIFPQVTDAAVVLISAGVNGVQLSRTPVGPVRVVYSASGVALTLAAGAPAAGEYRIVGTVVEVNAADLAKDITVFFQYVPSVVDLIQIGGDNTPTTFSSMVSTLGVTGVIEAGTVAISLYDVTVDWDSWTPAIGLKAGANGVVVAAAGLGATINGRVVKAPTAADPFLYIDFSVV